MAGESPLISTITTDHSFTHNTQNNTERKRSDHQEEQKTTKTKKTTTVEEKKEKMSKERAMCEAIGSACIERVGGGSPLSLLSSMPTLLRDFWFDFIHIALFARPVALTLFSWGSNGDGELCLGDTKKRKTPEVVRSLTGKGIVQVACGARHSMILLGLFHFILHSLSFISSFSHFKF